MTIESFWNDNIEEQLVTARAAEEVIEILLDSLSREMGLFIDATAPDAANIGKQTLQRHISAIEFVLSYLKGAVA